jgi:hypothetical protein
MCFFSDQKCLSIMMNIKLIKPDEKIKLDVKLNNSSYWNNALVNE